jgi:hypothetical protein
MRYFDKPSTITVAKTGRKLPIDFLVVATYSVFTDGKKF